MPGYLSEKRTSCQFIGYAPFPRASTVTPSHKNGRKLKLHPQQTITGGQMKQPHSMKLPTQVNGLLFFGGIELNTETMVVAKNNLQEIFFVRKFRF